ncbi:MAG: DUF456 domain-containing protein [Flavobacteriaceae bacterium]
MEYFFLILGLILLIVGFLGSFLPIIPGPPLSWFGLLCLYFVKGIPFDYWFLGITLFITVVVSVLDYVIPAQGTKRFGGSKYGVWGTTIGLIVGILTPIPFGFIIGPFVGALIGELIYDSSNTERALKAALGSFIGFLAGTLIKVIVCFAFLIVFCYKVYQHWNIWF